jgi:hypothetical protein
MLMSILYNFFPTEIVDMIYLRTDFFTAINHIPEREFVIQQLFKKDTNMIIKKGNWGIRNKNYITILEILKKKCRRSLVYFKKVVPNMNVNEKMFKYNKNSEIIRGLKWNELLISVYEVKEHHLKYFEKKHRKNPVPGFTWY